MLHACFCSGDVGQMILKQSMLVRSPHEKGAGFKAVWTVTWTVGGGNDENWISAVEHEAAGLHAAVVLAASSFRAKLWTATQ